MKIFGVGRNYKKHAEELQNEIPSEPVIFLMPDTAILKNNEPFYYPSFSNDIHYEVELVLRICKEGKFVDPQFASKYYDQIGLGVDFTARDIQSELKKKGLPWSIAKGFNSSLPVSRFYKLEEIDYEREPFVLEKNGKIVQKGYTSDMIFDFNFLISYISRYFLLKTGDLIFTGTPEGVGKVEIGDQLVGRIGKKEMFKFDVR